MNTEFALGKLGLGITIYTNTINEYFRVNLNLDFRRKFVDCMTPHITWVAFTEEEEIKLGCFRFHAVIFYDHI